uniref:Uncharacterized protein n=1 Tax=Arundo donax TaxID=35708 RepID=A0A0A9HCP0_ARUDO
MIKYMLIELESFQRILLHGRQKSSICLIYRSYLNWYAVSIS